MASRVEMGGGLGRGSTLGWFNLANRSLESKEKSCYEHMESSSIEDGLDSFPASSPEG